jgi:hypothetical protein
MDPAKPDEGALVRVVLQEKSHGVFWARVPETDHIEDEEGKWVEGQDWCDFRELPRFIEEAWEFYWRSPRNRITDVCRRFSRGELSRSSLRRHKELAAYIRRVEDPYRERREQEEMYGRAFDPKRTQLDLIEDIATGRINLAEPDVQLGCGVFADYLDQALHALPLPRWARVVHEGLILRKGRTMAEVARHLNRVEQAHRSRATARARRPKPR